MEVKPIPTHLHDLVKSGFVDGSNYDNYRPDYEEDVVEEVVSRLLQNQKESCGSECEFLELGAGTGIMTRHLEKRLPKNRSFIASEPMPDFLKTLRTKSPNIRAEQFPAEAIPLPDNSVQGIVAAQSFHWFANETALKEMYRVLRPNGNIVLVWNYQDTSVDWVKTLNDMMDCHRRPEELKFAAGDPWKEAIDAFPGITLKVRINRARSPIQYTKDAMIGCVATVSSIARLPQQEKSKVLQGIRDFLDSNPVTSSQESFALPMNIDFAHYVKDVL